MVDQEAEMVELVHPSAVQPTAVFERTPGEIEIHELHPREAAVVRVEVPVAGLPTAIGDALREIAERMEAAGVELAGPPFTRYHAFGQPDVVAEIGFPVMRPAPAAGRVEPVCLPGGRVASIVHLGPFETIDQAYDQLQRTLDASGMHATGPMWEVYWSDPAAEPDPATWRTEVLVPLDPPGA
jgi:effector-binding domain-containing protein